ncbi:MAG: hypothetical protein ABL949_08015 [Fimbriimonadaceae bacterium]
MNKWIRSTLIVLSSLAITLVTAQIPRWTKDSTGPGVYGDTFVAMTSDAAGNIYVLGNVRGTANRNIRVIKYDPAGTQLWLSDYNGTANGEDVGRGLTVDAGGNVYVAGQVDGAFGAVIKLNAADGTVAWDTVETDVGEYQKVVVSSASTITAIGFQQSFDSFLRCARMGTATGGRVWTYELDTLMSLPGQYDVVVDQVNNTTYVGGTVDQDYYCAKLDAAGVVVWQALFDGFLGLDEFGAMALDVPNNSVYLTGTVDYYGFDLDWDTFKVNATTGARVWEKVYNGNGSGNDRAAGLILDGANNVVVFGESDTGLTQDATVIKYGPTATTLWTSFYDGPGRGDDFARAMTQDASGNLYLAGTAKSNTRFDMLLMKLNSSGQQLWSVLNNGTDNGNDIGKSLVLDPAGSLVLGGDLFRVSTNYDLRATKYYQSVVTPSASTIYGGTSVVFTVTLNENAAATTTIPVADDNADAITPSSVVITSGTNSKTFTMTTKPVAATTLINVTVGAIKTTITVNPPIPTGLTLSTASITGGQSLTGTVTLSGPAPAGGLVLSCWDTNAAIIAPGSVTVAEGDTTATFTITTNIVTSSSNGYVKVGINKTTKVSPILTVHP